jgi:hypothetical protein
MRPPELQAAPADAPEVPEAPVPVAELPPKKKKRIQQDTGVSTKDKQASVAKSAGFRSPAEYNFSRRQGLGDSLGYEKGKEKTNRVVTKNGLKTMNALTESLQSALTESTRIVSELMQDELANLKRAGDEEDAGGPGGDLPPGDEFGGDLPPSGGDEMGAMGEPPMGDEFGGPGGPGGDLPPSEPPMSDGAVGADTEGATALNLLREIRDFLGQLASVIVPQPEAEAEAGGPAAPIEGEGEGELDIPVEDPDAEAAEEGGEEGGGDGEEGGAPPEEEEEEEEAPAE